ncbi:MAG: response regulator transcription factor [Sporolactobacillus sp.]
MEAAKEKILVLEDERSIRSFIVLNLRHAGFEVFQAERGEDALRLLNEHPDIRLALLDVMLSGISGFDVCRTIREKGMDIGVIMLTARVQESDKVQGLDMGADDYITKPFSVAEMIARVRSLFRRLPAQVVDRQPVIRVSGKFKLDEDDERFFKDNEPIDLTPTEFSLIKALIVNEDQLLSRNALIDAVWGKNFVGDAKIIDVNIRRLRQKIEEDPSDPKYIRTHWGRGYIWSGTGE